MTSLRRYLTVPDRRTLFAAAVALLAWTACGGEDPTNPSDAGPHAGAGGGGASDGGISGCTTNPGAKTENCSHAGAAGVGAQEAAGAAGAPETAGGAGAQDGGASGTNGEPKDDFVPAAHAAFPLVTAQGGPVLKNIEIVPVYFGDDPLFDDLEKFTSWIVTSDYWKNAGAEYGVEAGTRLAAVQRPSAPPSPISDTQIAGWIQTWVADQTLPTPKPNTVFALFFQAGTTITNRSGISCRSFAGLHKTVKIESAIFSGDVPFIILPRCTYSADDDPLMIATNVASHEYIETATNPLNSTNPAWAMNNDAGPLEACGMLSGPAIADLCLSQSYDVVEGFTVQDLWSNAAAQAGRNPCQPSDPRHPYFTVSAETTIYHAQPGTTLTIQARAWSNMPAPDWLLGVNWGLVPYSDFDGQATLSASTVNNGDEVTATVTIPPSPAVVDGRSVYRFTIDSIDPINPNFTHPWPFLVIVP